MKETKIKRQNKELKQMYKE